MRKNPFRRPLKWALAAACLATMISPSAASSFTRECATRDLQILMLIEARENSNAISPEKLTDAMFTMMHARMVCHEGRAADALALYDNIAQSITVNTGLAERRR
jgi:hypothetical protein